MSELHLIKEMEEVFGFQLNRVENLDDVFKGIRKYYLDENNNVIALGIDFCPISLLPNNYLLRFDSLQKLSLISTKLSDYTVLSELKGLTNLNLSNNNLTDVEFLKELKGLTNLNLSNNNLTDYELLKELKGLTNLNLSNNNLKDVEILKELKGLTTLDLSSNNLKDVEILKELKGLTNLNLSYNNLKDVEILKELKGLTNLNLTSNNLKDVEILKELKGLTNLNLSYNNLKDVEILKELKGLTTLNLSYNNLKDVEILKELKGLTTLNLWNNNLTDVEFLKELKGLTTLNLWNNNLTDVEILKELKGLTNLDLSNNNLKDVEILKELKGLTTLNLSYNNLKDVEILKELKGLTTLDLSYNNLTDVEILKELKGLTTLDLDNNPIINPPEEIVEQGIEAIYNYFDEAEKQGLDYIYEAKVLIVGEPGSGKTTLTQKLKDNKKWQKELKGKKTDSTVGIIIDKLKFPYHKDESKEIKAHLWDFGGQDIQYVLHQYFFTERSLYILLADGRKELTNFNYWFEIIATLGKNCPVLVVLNENDCTPIKTFNINEFRDEFGEELKSIEERNVDFFHDDDKRFEALKNEIENKTSNLKHIGQSLPKKWVDIRKDIEEIKQSKAHITKSEYRKLCDKQGLTKKESQDFVLNYFHDLGIALNYKTDSNLRNKLILRPNWVIDALYVVLKDEKIEREKGVFKVNDIDELWEKEGYDSNDSEILLSLMQEGKFEIAYKLGKTDKYIVPILLPYRPIEYDFDKSNATQIHFDYQFMPKGIVARLIVRLHKAIATKNGEQIVWNKGVLLKHYDSTAEVTEKEQARKITIVVSGENPVHNKEMITIIRNEILEIHDDWFDNRLNFDELVPCNCEVCDVKPTFYTLDELNKRIAFGKAHIECRKEPYKEVKVRKLLEGIYIEDNYREHHDLVKSNNLTFNIDKLGQLVNQPEAGVFIGQKNYWQENPELSKKFDEILAKFNTKETQEVQILNDALEKFIDSKIAELGKKEIKETAEYKDLKVSNDWKAKVRLGVPLIKYLGIDLSIEKEWKISKNSKPENVIKGLRKFLYGQGVEKNTLKLKD